MPRAANNDRSLTLRTRVTLFSSWPLSSRPPASFPPCAASRTTTNRAAGVGGACCAIAKGLTGEAAAKAASAHLLQCIDCESAQQFREKVCRLLRHHRPGKSHFPQLLHADGVGEERDIRFAATYLVDSLA